MRAGSGLALAFAALLTGCRPTIESERPGRTIDSIKSPDGIPIVYETHGSNATRPALVFIHGWSCDKSYWSGQLEPFSRDFTVVALDLAGHGESGLGRKAWTIAAFGGDAAAVVEELGLERVILIGHSMGGDVVVEAARRLPGRVVGLVWVDTYRQLGEPRPQDVIEQFAQPFRTRFVEQTQKFVRGMFPENADPALVERVANDMSSAPPDVGVAALISAFSFDREIPRALKELNLPVVAINAESPAGDVESLKRHGVEVVQMPGVGHFLMMEDPARFNTLLRRAIDTFAP
jgi:pimeloyl-ACP methyl ester carboxylesterase